MPGVATRLTSGSQRDSTTQRSVGPQSAGPEQVRDATAMYSRGFSLAMTQSEVGRQVKPGPHSACCAQLCPGWHQPLFGPAVIQSDPGGHGAAGGASQYAVSRNTRGT